LIKGLARDQGASVPLEIMVGIKKAGGSETWHTATLKDWQGQELNWEYNWQDIENGDYELRTKSTDRVYGTGINSQIVKVKVQKPSQGLVLPEIPPATSAQSTSTNVSNNASSTTTQPVTAETIQTRILELNKLLDQLQFQLKGQGSGATSSQAQNQTGFSFKINFKLGDKNNDVKKMQEILIKQGLLANGLNTGYFGSLTKQAVINFQEKHKAEILTPYGLLKGTGFVGPATRAKLNSLSD
jgi:hypothetical protein